jgi:hypothetical protein
MHPLCPTDLAPSRIPEYHWSPANQRAFLEALSTSGNISESAKAVSMSGQAAYAFCGRAAGRVFRLGWDAAVLVARRRVEGELLERALVGQEETYERDPDTGCVKRTRIHNGTTMAMLTRLDRMALGKSDVPADTAMAQIVAQDFERFLDLVEAGGGGAEAMLFLKARDGGLVPMAGFDPVEFAKHYQLSQKSGDVEEEETVEEKPELTPEEEAAKMSVWFCENEQDWRTNFPPPEDFCGVEDGDFGDRGYERTLDEDEEECYREQLAVEVAPLRVAGETARRAWFGLREGEEFTQRREDSEEEGAELPAAREPGPMEHFCMSAMIERSEVESGSERTQEGENANFDIVNDSTEDPLGPPPYDPTIRVLHSKPQPNYPAMGKIPPWAQRIY